MESEPKLDMFNENKVEVLEWSSHMYDLSSAKSQVWAWEPVNLTQLNQWVKIVANCIKKLKEW